MSHDTYPCHVFGILLSDLIPDVALQMTASSLPEKDGESASCHDEDFEGVETIHAPPPLRFTQQ